MLLRACLFLGFLLLALPCLLFSEGVRYSVAFHGVKDPKTLKSLEMASELVSLKGRPPASMNALRYRAESDLPTLLKVLHAHGYYEGKIDVQMEKRHKNIELILQVYLGPRYRLQAFDILLYCEDPKDPHQCCLVTLGDIGVQLDRPALTRTILDAQLKLLQRLSECGYPLAIIEHQEVIVDGKQKSVTVLLSVKTGQKTLFGPSTIQGTRHVKTRYITERLQWKAGELYDSRAIEATQNVLIDSGLFSSVLITHDEILPSNKEIPVKIDVVETKHKQINIGVSYQTVFGPGITFGWANRNVGRMGRTLSIQGDVTRISQTGVASYLHPYFHRNDQDMIIEAKAEHESLFAYSLRSYGLMNRFERKWRSSFRGSLAFQGERLYVTQSVNNGNFWVVALPIFLRWSTAKSLLNPTKGILIEYSAVPSFNVTNIKSFYCLNALTVATYFPLDRKERVVLADKVSFGTIFSPSLDSIPLSKRFLGGSEEELRGYRYRTVSPLVSEKPIGGRSAIYFTLEARLRLTNQFGLVPFFDVGHVWKTLWPTLEGKWLKSVGLGGRFFTLVGPFRIDVGIPLNRRKGIDPPFKVLVSIGQMF